MNARPLLIGATVAGFGTFGWVAFRTYVRSRVVETLNTRYKYDETVATLSQLKGLGIDLKLPAAEEFAESAVPVWSVVMPDEAFADILNRGRKSVYWPKKYKKGAASEKLEPYLLAIFRKSLQQGSSEQKLLQTVGELAKDSPLLNLVKSRGS